MRRLRGATVAPADGWEGFADRFRFDVEERFVCYLVGSCWLKETVLVVNLKKAKVNCFRFQGFGSRVSFSQALCTFGLHSLVLAILPRFVNSSKGQTT